MIPKVKSKKAVLDTRKRPYSSRAKPSRISLSQSQGRIRGVWNSFSSSFRAFDANMILVAGLPLCLYW